MAAAIDKVDVRVDLDPYLSLRAAVGYTGLSVRTLRGWLTNPGHPLPCYRVNGKILLRRSELDRWLSGFRSVGQQDLDAMVENLIDDIRGESNTESGSPPAQPLRNKGMTAKARKRVAGRLQE